MADGFVNTAGRMAAAYLSGHVRTEGAMTYCRTQVEFLFPLPEQCGHDSALCALAEGCPVIREHREGQAPVALLLKARGLRHRAGALEPRARESRRGGGPPLSTPPHHTTLVAPTLSANAALLFVLAWCLSYDHPDYRPPRAG